MAVKMPHPPSPTFFEPRPWIVNTPLDSIQDAASGLYGSYRTVLKSHHSKKNRASAVARLNDPPAPLDLSNWSFIATEDEKLNIYDPLTPITFLGSISHIERDPASPTTVVPPTPRRVTDFLKSISSEQPVYGGFSLPDLPQDIFSVFVSLAPTNVLAKLAVTCKALHAQIAPILYRNINLTYFAPVYEDPSIHYPDRMPVYDHSLYQRQVIQTLIESPHLAKHIKSFSFTLGLCSPTIDGELYRLFNVLTSVETLNINGLPSGVYPLNFTTLADSILPALKHVNISGHMSYYTIERILCSGKRSQLETVEIDVRVARLTRKMMRKTKRGMKWDVAVVGKLIDELKANNKGLKKLVVGGLETVLC
ncbi:hypothetical protein K504DRAFT_506239 [Pleomassaria siparia CBS 279.74]|uniref:F-box domain-containing protein n=1 Tax=Pleomassaria siparia CBS 279.74 TaxID=1314801 RepID=A0A6G1JYF9_9PLEO|nr:hypothetical protein K504DRAFT_506239 [Pleomassaria siparia CBS 279.74]